MIIHHFLLIFDSLKGANPMKGTPPNINTTSEIQIMNTLLITCLIAGYQWLIILLVVLLLFGGKKIPELMRGMGKGVRAFKEGMNEVDETLNEATKPAPKAAEKKEEVTIKEEKAEK